LQFLPEFEALFIKLIAVPKKGALDSLGVRWKAFVVDPVPELANASLTGSIRGVFYPPTFAHARTIRSRAVDEKVPVEEFAERPRRPIGRKELRFPRRHFASFPISAMPTAHVADDCRQRLYKIARDLTSITTPDQPAI
jgi:hypothetical protein